MAKKFIELNSSIEDFVNKQRIFFVATADVNGDINLSPKGMDTLKIFSAKRIVWLNLTGSGNKTAEHLFRHNRLTMMFCSFEEQSLIVRIYGSAKVIHEGDIGWESMVHAFPKYTGTRQFIDVSIERVLTSCGEAVPLYKYQKDRTSLEDWAKSKTRDGIREYWKQYNQIKPS